MLRICRLILIVCSCLGAALSLAGCGKKPDELRVHDLNAGERQYVERFLILERARAVAMADPVCGTALLDSLAVAWGDTAASVAEAALSRDPRRVALLHDLVRRLLEAEADSLIHAPHPRRLTAPWPQPAPSGDRAAA